MNSPMLDLPVWGCRFKNIKDERNARIHKIGRIESTKTHHAIQSKRSPLSRWIGLSVDFARCLCFAIYHDGVQSGRTKPLRIKVLDVIVFFSFSKGQQCLFNLARFVVFIEVPPIHITTMLVGLQCGKKSRKFPSTMLLRHHHSRPPFWKYCATFSSLQSVCKPAQQIISVAALGCILDSNFYPSGKGNPGGGFSLNKVWS